MRVQVNLKWLDRLSLKLKNNESDTDDTVKSWVWPQLIKECHERVSDEIRFGLISSDFQYVFRNLLSQDKIKVQKVKNLNDKIDRGYSGLFNCIVNMI